MKISRLLLTVILAVLTVLSLCSCDAIFVPVGQTPPVTPEVSPPAPCQHNWVNGRCAACMITCDHESITDSNRVCEVCGVTVEKSTEVDIYVDGTFSGVINYSANATATVVQVLELYFDCDWSEIIAEYSVKVNGAIVSELYVVRDADCIELTTKSPATPPADCNHEWISGYCNRCESYCDHSVVDRTYDVCVFCGFGVPDVIDIKLYVDGEYRETATYGGVCVAIPVEQIVQEYFDLTWGMAIHRYDITLDGAPCSGGTLVTEHARIDLVTIPIMQ